MMLHLEPCLLIRLGQECEDRFKGSVCLESCVAFIFNLFKDVSISAISQHLVVLFPLSVDNLELLQMSAKIPSFQTQTRISRRLWMQRSSPTSVQEYGWCCPFYFDASFWTCLLHHKFIKWTFPTRLVDVNSQDYNALVDNTQCQTSPQDHVCM